MTWNSPMQSARCEPLRITIIMSNSRKCLARKESHCTIDGFTTRDRAVGARDRDRRFATSGYAGSPTVAEGPYEARRSSPPDRSGAGSHSGQWNGRGPEREQAKKNFDFL